MTRQRRPSSWPWPWRWRARSWPRQRRRRGGVGVRSHGGHSAGRDSPGRGRGDSVSSLTERKTACFRSGLWRATAVSACAGASRSRRPISSRCELPVPEKRGVPTSIAFDRPRDRGRCRRNCVGLLLKGAPVSAATAASGPEKANGATAATYLPTKHGNFALAQVLGKQRGSLLFGPLRAPLSKKLVAKRRAAATSRPQS